MSTAYQLPSIAKVAELLGGDVRGDEALAPGPGHSAADRSLSVKIDSAAPDGFLVNSFCGDDAIVCRDHVRTKLGLPPFEPKKQNGKGAGASKPYSPTVAKYVYRLADGAPYLCVHRLADKSGFPQYRWDGEKWVGGKPKGPKIPYRLPELIAALGTTLVYFVEGEKDCLSLAKVGLTATTVSEGAEAAWKPELTKWFKDKHIVVIPDNDAPGRKHAEKVARAIDSVTASLRVLELPGLPPKGDVSDWLKRDTAGVELTKLAKAAPLWEPGTVLGDDDSKGDEEEGDEPSAPASTRKKTKSAPPPPVDRDQGAALLDDVRKFLARFVIYPSPHAHIAHVLWNAHAHMMEAWESTPRIAFLSPEPASGKTRSMEVTELLVPDPVAAVNVTPAYLFRKVGGEDDGLPTILFDEIDTVFGAKAKEHEELRALLNSGHRRGAVAGRCVVRGATVATEEISSYCAVALAGLGWLPDTILSRSIIIRMRRRAPDEMIEPFRRRVHAPVGEALRRRLAGWAITVLKEATAARPAMPPGVEDRAADLWEPLLAVADIAGGDWPKLARDAATALVAVAQEVEPSLNMRLLTDLRTIFGGDEALTTKEALRRLCVLEDAPWAELKGKPLSSNGVARRLRDYGVKSKTLRLPDGTFAKGYARQDLFDVWRRYLPPDDQPPPPPSSEKAVTGVTSVTDPSLPGLFDAPETSQASDEPSPETSQAQDDPEPDEVDVTFRVTPCDVSGGQKNINEINDVSAVTAVTPYPGDGGEGIGDHIIRLVAKEVEDWTAARQGQGAPAELSDVAAEIRRRLAARGVFWDHVETEAERVLRTLFDTGVRPPGSASSPPSRGSPWSNAPASREREPLAGVLIAWSAAIGIGQTRTMDQVIATANNDRDLKAALVAVAAMDDGQTVSNVRLDRWLRSVNEVEVDQLMLRGGGVDDGSVKWTLTLRVEPDGGSLSL